MYLGDQRLEPIYAEVAARKSVVFAHPTSPPQPTGGPDLPAPVLEFMFETTRSITDLVLSGMLRRYPTSGSSFRTPAQCCRCWHRASTCSPPH
ncbi:MAG: amidohydrolase [Mycobacterium sp.]|jgi:hypothetical protein|nr:amidohydrolase [Mycobacterium sp.]